LRWEVIFVWVMSTIPPISTTITSHFKSLNDGQQFHQYQQKSHLTSTHWLMVNNSTNIRYWWNCWHHSMSWCEKWVLLILVELFTITQWVKMRGDFYWYWWNCWPSLNELRWELMFAYQQKLPLYSTHWVMVNNSTNINKNHLSPQFIEWWSTIPPMWDVILVDIGRIVDHHSMSLGERWFLLILVELLTIIQWLKMRGDFCWYKNSTNINKNHLSF
jgi:hypothetical protein